MESLRVYCAGPLFNQSERDEMSAIADVLVAQGHSVYLPHRDGMEFRLVREVLIDRGWEADLAGAFLHEAIFALDVYQLVIACNSVVWNLNGRVPDEGAVSEAAIAWTLGKTMIAYQDDVRSMIAGRMNPLLVGLVDFTAVQQIKEIPAALMAEWKRHPAAALELDRLSTKLKLCVERGTALWQALSHERAQGENEIIADCVVQLFAPENAHATNPKNT